MSTRSWKERVEDILEAIHEIQAFVAGMTYAQFQGDAKSIKAVIADFTIIGEAARHVPDEVVTQHPEVPWGVMVAMRNRMVHVYFSVDPQILWDTIYNDLPLLVQPLEHLLKDTTGQ
jgi:uncharacterized protein with HEPN domain